MQTPITVTSPSDVCVTPDTNRPVGSEALPDLSTSRHGWASDHSTTFRWPVDNRADAVVLL